MYRNSGSNSNPRRAKPQLSKTLKRRPRFHQTNDDDLRWLYAAYRKGSFDWQENLTAAEFNDKAIQFLLGFDQTYTLTAATGRGDIPVGLVVAAVEDHRMQPHVLWFAWASARNKIESAVNFINQMRPIWKVIITVEEKNWGFFTHVMKHGVLDRCGKINGYYGNGNAMIFYSKDV